MLIDSLAFTLEKSGCLDTFWGKLDAGEDATLGVAASARPFLVAARFAHAPQPTLVVVAGEDAAVAFARNVAAYVGEERVLRFPERDDYPFDPKPADRRVIAQRMEAAWALKSGREVVVVASARALLRLLPPVEANAARPIALTAGEELEDMGVEGVEELGDLPRALEAAGYANTGELDGPGTFAVRGGTVDVFPGNLSFPVRLDFFGDELDEIRRIVPATGQTISSLPSVEIYPVSEFPTSPRALADARRALEKPALTNPALRDVLEKLEGGLRFDGADVVLPFLYKKPVTLGAYAGAGTCAALIEPRSLFDDAAHAADDIAERARGTNIALAGLFAEPAALDFGGEVRATYVSIMRVGGALDDELPVKRVDVAGMPDKIFGKLKSLAADRYTIVFSAPNLRARETMRHAFVDHGIPIQIVQPENLDDGESQPESTEADTPAQAKRRLRRGVVNIVDNDIPLGMIIPKAHLALVSAADTQGSRAASRRVRSRVDATEVTFPFKPGDYVVHAAHGIAFFRDLVRREVDGTERDYLQLEYAEGDKLFVPVEQLDRVTRYVGPEGGSPRLTRLNTSDWARAMNRARKATKKLAFDLVDVYARRAATQGFRFSPDTPWQREMEEAFPYTETRDQLAAIADVKHDMESPRPMDRLICGDVGFGKTEVALRAAFKATQDGKQVMVLCPTTILAQQHYTSFKDRFDPFDVTVEVLSRFRTPEQQKAALEGFAKGDVQVLVGTHRLLSRDVNPHDLGLVIIDEEQRFGVQQKERLKDVCKSADILTLSATPIPRTLNMALSGIRDMSVIEEAPHDRHPVQTYVMEYDPGVISDAIKKELRRGGQVYYLHNDVASIERVAAGIRERVPEARIGIGHGKMSEQELSEVWRRLMEHEIDVLVCTTIIETGVDVPNANTLIIDNADRMGLSQLHQLRGRVGRSTRRAYAYFTFTRGKVLSEISQKRLAAIREFTEFGSGFKIAMRDLEIRGAGNILGGEQHGHMESVGYDMYLKLLNEAVAMMKGEAPENPVEECTVDMQVQAHIPESYIDSTALRLDVYRRIADIKTYEDSSDVVDELIDRFGEPPESVYGLIDIALLRNRATQLGITEVKQQANALLLYKDKFDMERVKRLIQGMPNKVMLSAGSRPYISVALGGKAPLTVLEDVLKVLCGDEDAKAPKPATK